MLSQKPLLDNYSSGSFLADIFKYEKNKHEETYKYKYLYLFD